MKKYIVVAAAAVTALLCAWVLARAYTYKYRSQDTIVVTGLGETEFTSDLIVWTGTLTAEAQDAATGYAQIEASKAKVQQYLAAKGLPADAVVFEFVNVEKQFSPVYNANGNWPASVSRAMRCVSASPSNPKRWKRSRPFRARFRRSSPRGSPSKPTRPTTTTPSSTT